MDIFIRIIAIISVMNCGLAINAYFKGDEFEMVTSAISCLAAVAFLFVLTKRRER